MATANKLFNNFVGGAVTPFLRARTDLETYLKSVAVMQNFFSRNEGGASYRMGTNLVSQTRGNRIAFLVPFQFSDIQAFELEFTDQSIRFLINDGMVTEAAKPIETLSSDGVFFVTNHGFTNGQTVFLDNIDGPDSLNGQFFIVANATTNTFTLQAVTGSTEKGQPVGITLAFTSSDVEGDPIDISGLDAYVGSGTVARVYEISTPYLEADLELIQYAQDGDTIYLVHRNYAPMKLVRTSNTSWTLGTYTRTNDPFTGIGDYPGVVCFIDSGRLIMGSTINHPSTIWGSQSPSSGTTNFDNFKLGTTPTSGISFTLSPLNGKIDAIRWIANTSKFMVVGCYGSIRLLYGNTITEAISPISVQAPSVNNFAAAPIPPVVNGISLFYVQRGGLILRSLEYDFLQDWYDTVDRNLVTKHITLQGYRKIIGVQGNPDIIWAVMNDGRLIAMTHNEKEQISGWHTHYIGGTSLAEDGITIQPWAKVISIGSLPRDDGYDQLWLTVQRQIGGQTVNSIEFMSDQIDYPVEDDFFTDEANEVADRAAYRAQLYKTQKAANHLDMAANFDSTNAAALSIAVSSEPKPGAWAIFAGGFTGQLVRKFDQSGQLMHVATIGSAKGLAIDGDNNRYFLLSTGPTISSRSLDGSVDGQDAFTTPADIFLDGFDLLAQFGGEDSVGNKIVLSSDGAYLYAAVFGADKVTLNVVKVSVSTGTVVAYGVSAVSFSARKHGLTIALSSDGLLVYIIGLGAAGVYVESFDAALNSLGNVAAGINGADTACGSAISDDGSTIAFIACSDSIGSQRQVTVIDTASLSFSSFIMGGEFTALNLAFVRGTNDQLYIPGQFVPGIPLSADRSSVSIVSTGGALLGSYSTGNFMESVDTINVDPATGVIYMFDATSDSAFILDPAEGGLMIIVPLGEPSATAFVFENKSNAQGTIYTVTADRDTFTPGSVGQQIVSKSASGGSAEIIDCISARQVLVKQLIDLSNDLSIASNGSFLASTVVTGLAYLEGETVGVIADGGAHPDCVVQDGKITLEFPVTTAIVGYKFKGIIKSLNLDVGGITGPAQGKTRVIPHVIINFLNSVGTKFGSSLYKLKAIVFRKTTDEMDVPTLPVTGNDKIVFRDNYNEKKKEIVIVQDVPLPCNILGLDIEVATSDDQD